jgi:hypothetical protein
LCQVAEHDFFARKIAEDRSSLIYETDTSIHQFNSPFALAAHHVSHSASDYLRGVFARSARR